MSQLVYYTYIIIIAKPNPNPNPIIIVAQIMNPTGHGLKASIPVTAAPKTSESLEGQGEIRPMANEVRKSGVLYGRLLIGNEKSVQTAILTAAAILRAYQIVFVVVPFDLSM